MYGREVLHRIAALSRRLPDTRAKIRLGRLIAVTAGKRGGSPVLTLPLKDGTIMVLDARGRTEAEAVWTGTYDQHTIDVLKACMRPDGTLLDVGANVGLIAVPMACWLAHRGGRVIAVEPISSNAARIRTSAALNRVDIQVIQCAMGDRDGTVSISRDGRDANFGVDTGNAITAHAGQGYGPSTTVDLRTIDGLLDDVPPVDAIKMDIEGAELSCLHGAQRFVANHRPLILGEFNSQLMPKFGCTFADVGLLLDTWDYQVVAWEAADDPAVVPAEAGRGNAMLVPTERLATVLDQLRTRVPAD